MLHGDAMERFLDRQFRARYPDILRQSLRYLNTGKLEASTGMSVFDLVTTNCHPHFNCALLSRKETIAQLEFFNTVFMFASAGGISLRKRGEPASIHFCFDYASRKINQYWDSVLTYPYAETPEDALYKLKLSCRSYQGIFDPTYVPPKPKA